MNTAKTILGQELKDQGGDNNALVRFNEVIQGTKMSIVGVSRKFKQGEIVTAASVPVKFSMNSVWSVKCIGDDGKTGWVQITSLSLI